MRWYWSSIAFHSFSSILLNWDLFTIFSLNPLSYYEEQWKDLKFPEMREFRRRRKPYTINVEGIVGTGKSTFLEFFEVTETGRLNIFGRLLDSVLWCNKFPPRWDLSFIHTSQFFLGKFIPAIFLLNPNLADLEANFPDVSSQNGRKQRFPF